MKNQLPELTPKPESWDQILQKSEFESQLGNHLSRLPQFSPNEETWGKITGELDRKKTIPIWVKWSVAASILGFLLVAGLLINETFNDSEIKNLEILTNLSEDSDSENANQDLKTTEQPPLSLPEESAIASTFESLPVKKKTQRNVEIIELPKINLSEIEPNHQANIGLSLPEVKLSESSKTKTIHKVSISWRKLKPGLQVTTPFGVKELNPTIQTQATTEPSRHITIEINN